MPPNTKDHAPIIFISSSSPLLIFALLVLEYNSSEKQKLTILRMRSDLYDPVSRSKGQHLLFLMAQSTEQNFVKIDILNFDNTIDDILHVKPRLIVSLNLRCYSDQALLQLILRRGVNHLFLHFGIVVTPAQTEHLNFTENKVFLQHNFQWCLPAKEDNLVPLSTRLRVGVLDIENTISA